MSEIFVHKGNKKSYAVVATGETHKVKINDKWHPAIIYTPVNYGAEQTYYVRAVADFQAKFVRVEV